MLYTDLELPDDVRDALVADIEHLPLLAFSILLQREPEFAPGFRPDPKNLAAFRKRLVEKFLNPSVALTKKEVEAIRHHGFNMKAADISGDGDVNAVDFNMVGNMILNGSTASARERTTEDAKDPE